MHPKVCRKRLGSVDLRLIGSLIVLPNVASIEVGENLSEDDYSDLEEEAEREAYNKT